MKNVLIAAVAAISLVAGIGAALADGTDAKQTQLFRDRGAVIVTPEDPRAPVPFMTQYRRMNAVSSQRQTVMSGGYGDSLAR
jgi:hypothetical protein